LKRELSGLKTDQFPHDLQKHQQKALVLQNCLFLFNLLLVVADICSSIAYQERCHLGPWLSSQLAAFSVYPHHIRFSFFFFVMSGFNFGIVC